MESCSSQSLDFPFIRRDGVYNYPLQYIHQWKPCKGRLRTNRKPDIPRSPRAVPGATGAYPTTRIQTRSGPTTSHISPIKGAPSNLTIILSFANYRRGYFDQFFHGSRSHCALLYISKRFGLVFFNFSIQKNERIRFALWVSPWFSLKHD